MSDAPTRDTASQRPGTRFRRRLRDGDTLLGIWCAIDSPATVEALAGLGPDWLMIDGEHGLADAARCLPLIQAADRGGVCVLVRVPVLEPTLIARVLDAGAHGVMLPKVSDPARARALVDACLYPPAGNRGIGPHRAARYGLDRDYLREANDAVVIAAQIEEAAAVERLDDLLAVDRLDLAFVGPADLSASLGHVGDPGHAEVRSAMAKVVEASANRGVACGIYCLSSGEAQARIGEGFRVVNVASDLGTLVGTVAGHLRDTRG